MCAQHTLGSHGISPGAALEEGERGREQGGGRCWPAKSPDLTLSFFFCEYWVLSNITLKIIPLFKKNV